MGKALCLPLLTTLIILGEPVSHAKKTTFTPLNPGWLIGILITGLFESLYTWVVFHHISSLYIYMYPKQPGSLCSSHQVTLAELQDALQTLMDDIHSSGSLRKTYANLNLYSSAEESHQKGSEQQGNPTQNGNSSSGFII